MPSFSIPKIKLEKVVVLTGPQAIRTSLYSITFSFLIFMGILLYEGKDPLLVYQNMFSFAFDPSLGLPLMIHRSAFVLFNTLAFIIPLRAGLWNIGMEGQFYLGTIGAFAIAYTFPQHPSEILIPVMLVTAMACGAAYGAIAGLLRGRLNVNEVVTTLMLNNIAFWIVYLLVVGGPWAGIAESSSRPLPKAAHAPHILNTPFTSFVVLGMTVALFLFFLLTTLGYKIRVLGHSPTTAKYVGISEPKISILVMSLGGAVAGFSGYHMWAGDPAYLMIPRPEAYKAIGDLTYWGIIIGLVSLLNPLAAIPVSFFTGSVIVGSTVLVRRFRLPFGLDFLFLGIISIAFAAFQFFYNYRLRVRGVR